MIGQISASAWQYGVLLTLAFSAGILLFWFNRPVGDEKGDHFINLSLLIAVFAIVGARVLYILLFPQYFNGWRDWLALHEGGLVFYGGFIGATLAVLIYTHHQNLSLSKVLDSLVPSLALGQAIGRLGCFSNHCCYGRPTEFCQFYHLPGDPAGVFRHPTQLYESAYMACIFLYLQLSLRHNRQQQRHANGYFAVTYIFAYTLFRFLIEFIRGDDRGGTILGLSISQLVSLALLAVTATFCFYQKHSGKSNE